MADAGTAVPQAPAVSTAPPIKAGGYGGAIVISIFSLVLLMAALVFAYIMKNENLLVLLAGVIATNATAVVSYWVGSSASSQSKDMVISRQLPTPTSSTV